ncbi:MAG: hemerythrin domain-containing protein [Bacteroidales bacterium]|nr:hemerythrin domain-containing protein [Bacteroidales bacterium]MBQ8761681.1 hemerythrin domain-containing protein [Bacteroidales bacterium]
MNDTKTQISENTKMAELILSNPNLMLTLSRFGIELGFGDSLVKDVCKKADVNTAFFLLICNLYTDQNFIPSTDDINSVNINTLLSYLSQSHKYYVEERIPHIENHLNRIVEACPKKFGVTIERFFKEYKQEVINHFSYEEDTVFPYINALGDKSLKKSFSIDEFKCNHSNIEDKLNDLMNILIKYLPAEIFPKERIEISLDIVDLSSDLKCHTLVEERVLVPFVELLEKQCHENM